MPRIALLVLLMPLISCAGERPTNLGVNRGSLAPCAISANCVSSDAPDAAHQVAPFELDVDPAGAWATARQAVVKMARTEIIEETDDYLYAECRSALLGFVDDLELHLRPDEGIIAVRSASRLGESDLGVNRARIEKLRAALGERGVLKPSD